MADNQIIVSYNSGNTIYATLQRDSDGQVVIISSGNYEVWNASHISQYKVALTEAGSSGRYSATIPSTTFCTTLARSYSS